MNSFRPSSRRVLKPGTGSEVEHQSATGAVVKAQVLIPLIPGVNRLPNSLVGSTREQRR